VIETVLEPSVEKNLRSPRTPSRLHKPLKQRTAILSIWHSIPIAVPNGRAGVNRIGQPVLVGVAGRAASIRCDTWYARAHVFPVCNSVAIAITHLWTRIHTIGDAVPIAVPNGRAGVNGIGQSILVGVLRRTTAVGSDSSYVGTEILAVRHSISVTI
jgi:hypothetical protein